jgi:hypothetical protein
VVSDALHPDLEQLGGLLGTWSGRGQGEYPTIARFQYEETVNFSHVGKPFLIYSQRTRHLDDGRPLHAEVGFLRLPRRGWVELIVSHPTGIAEIAEGTVEGSTMKLASTAVAKSSSAKEVTCVMREFVFTEAILRYTLSMAAVGQPLTHHLAAELKRVG